MTQIEVSKKKLKLNRLEKIPKKYFYINRIKY